MSCIRACDRCGFQHVVEAYPNSKPVPVNSVHLAPSHTGTAPAGMDAYHTDLCLNCIHDVEQFMKTKIERPKC